MHNNRHNCKTMIIPQTIIVPTISIIAASLSSSKKVHSLLSSQIKICELNWFGPFSFVNSA